MDARKFGSREDLELKPVRLDRSGINDSQHTESDIESEEDNKGAQERKPMLQKPPGASSSETKPPLKPKPAPRKTPSNPNLLTQSQKSLQSIGKEKPVPTSRHQSKSSLLTGEVAPPPTGNQPGDNDSVFIRQGELAYNNTGEKEGDTTVGDISQVQTFNFQPQPPPLQMGEVDEQPSPTGLLGWVGFGCSVFALACLCVSFASPYWMQTYPMSFNTFQNMGLWEICMKDYMHHKDDSQTIYDGCWWVFNRDEKYWKLREWLLPPWFITCQVMVTMNLICHFAAIGIIVLIFLHCCPIINHEYHQSYAMFAASGLCFFITILSLITGIMYGVFCGDRNWMPRPDLNFISWGFGFLIIQGIISTVAGVCYFLEAQKAFNELDRRDQEYTKAVLDMEMSQAYPAPSYGAPSYGHQSYDQGSTYSGQQGYPMKPTYSNQPSYDMYKGQPSYDQHSTGHYSDRGSSYNEKPPYPGMNT